MTLEEKQKAIDLRKQGKGYGEIAFVMWRVYRIKISCKMWLLKSFYGRNSSKNETRNY